MRYVHVVEDVGTTPSHQIDTFARNIYGLILQESHPSTSMTAWELAVGVRKNPEDINQLFKAIYFIRDFFSKPIRMPHNHFNIETMRELFADIDRVGCGLPRYKTTDATIALLHKEDQNTPSLTSSRYYRWQLSKHGVVAVCNKVDNIVDMLCTISALTKLLQK